MRPPFGNKPKLDFLFVLTVAQLTLHIGCIKRRKQKGKENYEKKFSVIPGTIKADL